MTIGELQEKRVAILGLGVNNWELVRYLAQHGVRLEVCERDASRQIDFEKAFPKIKEHVTWKIGKNILDGLDRYQVVFRSPSIPVHSPALVKASKKGVVVYSQTRLFFDLCPCPIIGVSGTKGKGTTCTLLHKILSAGYKGGASYLAGNIGVDPFSFLDDLQPSDRVILELSSFQLQDLEKSPQTAILLTVGSDHLDHHKSLAEYQDAKSSLLRFQGKNDVAVINVQDPAMKRYLPLCKGRLFAYNRFYPARQSAWVDIQDGAETVFIQIGEEIDSFVSTGRRLLGEHNLDNILPAALVARLEGIPVSVIQQEVVDFAGLEHRLSHIGHYGEYDFYDDSIATMPESCLVAMQAFSGRRIHLIAGGSDKGADYTALAGEILNRCVSVTLLPGAATKRLSAALRKQKKRSECQIFESPEKVSFPALLSGINLYLEPGDVVLLAPAAASFASFKNYKERGDLFAAAVRERYGKLEP
ncbi:MAG: UDP-N-acetylmuramoyl-L-alanine--D-glutamate ligase [bacterium]